MRIDEVETRKSIEGLICDTVEAKPREFNFGAGYAKTWDVVYPAISEWTKKQCISYLEEMTGTMDEGGYETLEEWQDAAEGFMMDYGIDRYTPMMNYIYPLPNLNHTPEKAQALVDDTNCVVVVVDDEPYLALGGCGMDMSWDICKAYMILGYMPQVHFCRLPEFAGKKLTVDAQWIIDGCKVSCQTAVNWHKNLFSDLERLEKSMPKD